MIVVGVISDTHGLLRPEAALALAGSDVILHAGDIGSPDVLAALGAIAPVFAVRGNNDHGPWADELPENEWIEVGGVSLYLLHDVSTLDVDPRDAGLAVVIAGHSHKPARDLRDGVLFFNPGSAGPRRFQLPIAVGRLTVERGAVDAKTILL
jgi:putative phosphoesterase